MFLEQGQEEISMVVEGMSVYLQPLFLHNSYQPSLDQRVIDVIPLLRNKDRLNLDQLLELLLRLTQIMLVLGNILKNTPLMTFSLGDWKVVMISLSHLVQNIIPTTYLAINDPFIVLMEFRHLAIRCRLIKSLKLIFRAFEPNLQNFQYHVPRQNPEEGNILDYHTFKQFQEENLLSNEQREDFNPDNEEYLRPICLKTFRIQDNQPHG